jgi:hypothetical protein
MSDAGDVGKAKERLLLPVDKRGIDLNVQLERRIALEFIVELVQSRHVSHLAQVIEYARVGLFVRPELQSMRRLL